MKKLREKVGKDPRFPLRGLKVYEVLVLSSEVLIERGLY